MPALEDTVLTHINDGLDYLQQQRKITDETLNRFIATFGGRFDESPGQVSYAGLSHNRNGPCMHLVLQSEQGPVSVLIMPNESTNRRQFSQ